MYTAIFTSTFKSMHRHIHFEAPLYLCMWLASLAASIDFNYSNEPPRTLFRPHRIIHNTIHMNICHMWNYMYICSRKPLIYKLLSIDVSLAPLLQTSTQIPSPFSATFSRSNTSCTHSSSSEQLTVHVVVVVVVSTCRPPSGHRSI